MSRNKMMVAAICLALLVPAVTWAQSTRPYGQRSGITKATNPCAKAATAGNPCADKITVAASGMPALNPCHAKSGTVFYVNDPMGRNNITFTSEAPLEDIVGTSNEIRGYVVYDPNRSSSSAMGRFAVPVASLDTGIPLRDEHLVSPMWLNAEKNPMITFELGKVTGLKLARRTSDAKTYEGKAEGKFSLNGVTREMEVPIRFSYMKESGKTQERLPGNLVVGRAEFSVPLAAHRIAGAKGIVGSKVSETIDVEVRFVASDEKPEMAANPCAKAGNPCAKAGNPCAKASNPCNPCAK